MIFFPWFKPTTRVQRIFSKSGPEKEPPSRKVPLTLCAAPALWIIYDRPRVRVQQVGETSFHTGLRFACVRVCVCVRLRVCVCTRERAQNHPVCRTRIEGFLRFCPRSLSLFLLGSET